VLTRRSLLRAALLLSADAAFLARSRASAPPQADAALHLRPGPPLASVPANFTGLGYEMSSAAQPGLLSAHNQPYVRLVRNLGPSGVLRLGGIVSDYTRYLPAGPPQTQPKNTVITRAALTQLRGFLDATGWTAIWSLNFGRGTLPQAIAEAKDVAAILGPRLHAVELGNEVENYSRGDPPLRTPPFSFSTYHAEYSAWRRAILAAVPGLRFAAPDTAASVDWVERMAADARSQPHPDVQLLTTHYYRGDQRRGTLAQLMAPDPELQHRLTRLRQASRASGIPWRMCETNSFFGGGRPGLSDTFAAALWTLDYMLLLASYGCAGVNIETGVNQLGFVSSYSPIRYDAQGRAIAGLPYYGMLAIAASRAAGADILPLNLNVDPAPSAPALSAYAIGRRTRLRSLVLIHRDPATPARIALPPLGPHPPQVLWLTAPSLQSQDQVRFAGSQVDANGAWTPRTIHHLRRDDIVLPPATAAVILAGDPA
jgi:hypothetical protein